MSISIYYTAERDHDLTESERAAVRAIESKYSVTHLIVQYQQTGQGPNWESFCLYDPTLTPGTVIEGATKLPDNSEEAVWVAIQHWCGVLSELRRLIRDAAWHVHVDDHDIPWDEKRQAYDPSR